MKKAASLSDTELAAIDAYWRAANYLSVGQIYLLANPLLREPHGEVDTTLAPDGGDCERALADFI